MTANRLAAGIVLIAAVALASTNASAGRTQNHAGIVVRYSDRDVARMCVAFDEPSISGLDLLERAGLPHLAERSAVGSAICRIDARGCRHPDEDCFCDYPTFWGYWTRASDDSEWTFSDLGAAQRDVSDGDLDGWSWGKDGKPAPPDETFRDVCAAAGAQTSVARESSDEPTASRRPNYLPFAALAFAFVAASVLLTRRRRR